MTITKSITIDCEGARGAILSPATAVNVTAPAGSIVTLRHLDIEGAAAPQPGGSNGVSVTMGANLRVENCRIFGFRASTALGIFYLAPLGATGELYVSDTVISENGTGDSNGGIKIQATNTGNVQAILTRVQLQNNSTGLLVEGTGGSGSVWVTVRDSVSAGNSGNGVTAIKPSASTNVFMIIDRSAVSNNGAFGVHANGANAFILVSSSVVAGNNVGLSAINGTGVYSLGNNVVYQNRMDDGTANPLPLR